MSAWMLSLDADALDRLERLRDVTQRTSSAILRMLVAQAAIVPGAHLDAPAPRRTRHVLFRPGPVAHRLDRLSRDAACSRSALVRQLLAQCPVPALPDLHLPPAISLVRPARPSFTDTGRVRGARQRATPRHLYALLRDPANEDLRERIEHLAAATGRSIGETLRLLVMQAQVSPLPDIHLRDGPVIVRITRVVNPGKEEQ